MNAMVFFNGMVFFSFFKLQHLIELLQFLISLPYFFLLMPCFLPPEVLHSFLYLVPHSEAMTPG